MKIRDFNQTAANADSDGTATLAAVGGSESARVPHDSIGDIAPHGTNMPEDAETALLRARIEHLELVVETARSLMTSNQERLLRRLHDLPHEMMALTAKMARHGTPMGMHGQAPDAASRQTSSLRRVQ